MPTDAIGHQGDRRPSDSTAKKESSPGKHGRCSHWPQPGPCSCIGIRKRRRFVALFQNVGGNGGKKERAQKPVERPLNVAQSNSLCETPGNAIAGYEPMIPECCLE